VVKLHLVAPTFLTHDASVLCIRDRQAAEANDCAIFVHPWDMQMDGRMKNYFLPWLVGRPYINVLINYNAIPRCLTLK